jgi:hypothetical protein
VVSQHDPCKNVKVFGIPANDPGCKLLGRFPNQRVSRPPLRQLLASVSRSHSLPLEDTSPELLHESIHLRRQVAEKLYRPLSAYLRKKLSVFHSGFCGESATFTTRSRMMVSYFPAVAKSLG